MTYALKPDAFPPSKAGTYGEWAPGGRRQLGFIAQEVEDVVPEVVAEDGNGYKTVAYSRLVPTLAAALSSALDRLDRLEDLRSALQPVTSESVPSFVTTTRIPAIDEVAPTDPSAIAPDGSKQFSDCGAPRRTVRRLGRRTAAVEVDGRQATEGSDSKPAVFDLEQLRVENTALRGRMGELEKRMVELERELEVVASVGADKGTGGATARTEA